MIGTARGFFWAAEDRIYLVSNWHVFAGRDPSTDQPIHSDGVLPAGIHFQFRSRHNFSWRHSITTRILDSNDAPLWIEHSKHGRAVDVAMIDVTAEIRRARMDDGYAAVPACINEIAQQKDMVTPVGADVFVLGFPLAVMETDILPIWKRASVATEYYMSAGGLPAFLIDTATREGMSGSPVLQRSYHGYQTETQSFAVPGPLTKFLGVYSGRQIRRIEEAQLGVVWRQFVILQILANPAPGTNHMR